jgi:hypothetical protein
MFHQPRGKMKRGIVFGALMLAGCGDGVMPNFGLGQPDAIGQAHADVERLAIQIKEENEAFGEDLYLARRAEGEEKKRLDAVVDGERKRLNQLVARKRSTEVRIRELEAERRNRAH